MQDLRLVQNWLMFTVLHPYQFVELLQVQILVEKNTNMDLKHALELAADVQPIKVDATTIEDVNKGISREVIRSTLAECSNLPCLAAKTAQKMDDAVFETNEEKAPWETFLSVKNKVHPGIEIDDFIEISADLVQPLEDFFNVYL
ncbi:glycine--tRNA ligase 2, chloroplastic/mitochondrial-like protein [Corchorus capsularis]|uniref:glycine--tRNA ligase n=1 Tax=Corchorus capsularis TaxID=210143 RepID=A0A1R3H8B4_COCAP|nr:glycine--tRNA ligase 2, chloroplastic/mitochondrial-like protein [Corchorus capsularis]